MHTTAFAMNAPTYTGGPCAGLADWLAAMSRHHGHSGERGRRGGFPGPWAFFGGAGPWGPPGFGGSRGPWRGPRARRGDIRAAILAVLAEQPMNGYQIIQEISERSGGMWKPSPGSIYPTLQQLEDEGLARTEVQEGRRTFELTDDGRAYVDSHADEMAAVWEAMSPSADDESDDVRPLIGQAAAALWQIMATGSPAQKARAREVLAETRRTLYGILANGDDADETGATTL
ncbi:MAG TPA: PadR family transcriptional regulator [Jiangellaceae bacterium]|nr:PadR family transcriptional regulator [Jiangellaceae bacterium]